jgi:hypothetical protein
MLRNTLSVLLLWPHIMFFAFIMAYKAMAIKNILVSSSVFSIFLVNSLAGWKTHDSSATIDRTIIIQSIGPEWFFGTIYRSRMVFSGTI